MKNFLIVLAMFFSTGALFAITSTPFKPEEQARFVAVEARATALEPAALATSYLTNGIFDVKIARATWDCATLSNCVVGSVSLGVALPAKALIRQAWFYSAVQPVSAGGGTLALRCEDANNIYTATDVTGITVGTITSGAPTGIAANMVKAIAAACNLTATIASADYTAGKLNVFVEYVVHD